MESNYNSFYPAPPAVMQIPIDFHQVMIIAQNAVYQYLMGGATDDTCLISGGCGNIVDSGDGTDVIIKNASPATTILATGTGFKAYSGFDSNDTFVLGNQQDFIYKTSWSGADLIITVHKAIDDTLISTHAFPNALYFGKPTIVGCNSFPAVDNIVGEEYSFYSNPEQTWGHDVAVVNPWDFDENYATEPITEELYQPITAPVPIFANEVTTADPFANMTPNYISPVAQPSYGTPVYGRDVDVVSPIF